MLSLGAICNLNCNRRTMIMFKSNGKKSNDERALSELQSRLATLQRDLATAEADEKTKEAAQAAAYRGEDFAARDNADDGLTRAQVRIKGLSRAIREAKEEIVEM